MLPIQWYIGIYIIQLYSFQKSQEVDPQKEAGERARADHDQQDWWQHYADSFWFRLFSRYRTFEAVTWVNISIEVCIFLSESCLIMLSSG